MKREVASTVVPTKTEILIWTDLHICSTRESASVQILAYSQVRIAGAWKDERTSLMFDIQEVRVRGI
jgi:hypothetical protein